MRQVNLMINNNSDSKPYFVFIRIVISLGWDKLEFDKYYYDESVLRSLPRCVCI